MAKKKILNKKSMDFLEKYLNNGMDFFLPKPITKDSLRDKLDEIFAV